MSEKSLDLPAKTGWMLRRHFPLTLHDFLSICKTEEYLLQDKGY